MDAFWTNPDSSCTIGPHFPGNKSLLPVKCYIWQRICRENNETQAESVIHQNMAKLLVIHGPNLNLLGTREPEHYGTTTLQDIDSSLVETAQQAGHSLTCLQSNAEHELVDAVHQAQADGVAWIIINPAAFTHTSVALRDALAAVKLPFIEVHLSNVHARESFRQQSYFSDLAQGVISGLGPYGYTLALLSVIDSLKNN